MFESISIITPVFNSSETLKVLHKRLVDAVEPLCQHFEIIMVEDGSTDNSWNSIKQLSQADPRVRGIRLMRNYGQHNALAVSGRRLQA